MFVSIVLCTHTPALDLALVRHVLASANESGSRDLIKVEIRSATGLPIVLSDGARVFPDVKGWERGDGIDLVLVLSGPFPLEFLPMGLRGFLHRAAKAGATVGGIGAGTHVLADLGLLRGREAVLAGDLSIYKTPLWPDIARSDARFVVERDRLTSLGGFAVAQAMLAWLASAVPSEIVSDVARSCAPDSQATLQRPEPEAVDPVMKRMRAIMAAHIDTPIPLTAIAHQLDLSAKQMRTRCQSTLNKTPAQVYLEMRLERARRLVHDTGHSVHEIASATGFASPSSFTRSYKTQFGETPRDWRRAQVPISRVPAYKSPARPESP